MNQCPLLETKTASWDGAEPMPPGGGGPPPGSRQKPAWQDPSPLSLQPPSTRFLPGCPSLFLCFSLPIVAHPGLSLPSPGAPARISPSLSPCSSPHSDHILSGAPERAPSLQTQRSRVCPNPKSCQLNLSSLFLRLLLTWGEAGQRGNCLRGKVKRSYGHSPLPRLAVFCLSAVCPPTPRRDARGPGAAGPKLTPTGPHAWDLPPAPSWSPLH